jgi:N-methylhydantoinase A
LRVGVDIGGTFTDVALEHPGGLATAKVLTDYAEPGAAILAGIRIAAGRAGVRPQDIGQVIHGTTLVTNALIERRGARMAFVTTQGFRDVIEMRSENRFEQYDLNLRLPDPLVPREHRLTVAERMSPEGEVLSGAVGGRGGAGRGRGRRGRVRGGGGRVPPFLRQRRA